MTPPVFYAELDGVGVDDAVVLSGDEGRHAADVRRLRVGEPVDLTDGRGRRARCTVTAVRRGELTAEVLEAVQVAQPSPRLVVVQALAKGGRDEAAVEAMTEVGVDEVVGWEASRNVAHWTDRTQAKWTSTARAAAKQSRRAWWPVITGPASTADVAARCGAAALAVVLHESATVPLASLQVPRDLPSAPAGVRSAAVVVVVGPEGGITDEELGAMSAAGAHVVRLGSEVLRSSTAGVAALSAICARSRWS